MPGEMCAQPSHSPTAGAADLVERLQEPALDEARDQEAVEPRDVGAGAGGEIERQLLGQLLVLAGELLERDAHVLALGLHLRGEGGDHALLDPFGGGAVHAALDAAAGDGEIGREGGRGEERRGGEHGGERARTAVHGVSSEVDSFRACPGVRSGDRAAAGCPRE